MSDAINNLGMILRCIDVDPTGLDIGELTNVSFPGGTRETIDVTHYASPGGRREFINGLIDPGEATLEGNFIDADEGQQYLKDAYDSGTVYTYVILVKNSGYISFDSIVTNFETVFGAVGEKISFSVTMKLTGEPKYL